MPAPPPESEPAMVSTCLRVVVMAVSVARYTEKSAYIYVATEVCPALEKSTIRPGKVRLISPTLPIEGLHYFSFPVIGRCKRAGGGLPDRARLDEHRP